MHICYATLDGGIGDEVAPDRIDQACTLGWVLCPNRLMNRRPNKLCAIVHVILICR